jgi:lipid A 3-O-deacylase
MRASFALKLTICLNLVLGSGSIAFGQTFDSSLPSHGRWELGTFAGGGTGLLGASGTQYLLAGVRIGRVLTRDHLHGWLRGNFEYAGDFMPVFFVYTGNSRIYGGNFTPVILKWNFTANRRFVPYLLLSGGGLVSTSNVPPGNTSYFNFVAGGSAGANLLLHHGAAVTFESRWVHISNANLGTGNPQLVSNFIFTIGYTWLK